MSNSAAKDNIEDPTQPQAEIRRLETRVAQQNELEAQLNETLHNLRVHEEELRAQNEDLRDAQREITQSQRKYRDLFDFAPIGYFLVGTDATIIEANLTGAKMLGRHRSRILGKPLFLFIAPTYRPVFERHLREIWAGHPASDEVAFAGEGNNSLPVELFSIPVPDRPGRIKQCRIAATDISKRRKAEAALEASEATLDAIMKTIPDIVYRLDANGMLDFISESIRRYGYAPRELMGKPLMKLVNALDRPMARHRIDERRTGERSTKNLELRLLTNADPGRHESGSHEAERYFLVNAEGLYAENKRLPELFMGTQGIAHDITERKQSEGEKRRLEAELQRARKLEAIGTLAGGIAHDFNNLLMGIQGCTSLLNLDLRKGREEQTLSRLEDIEQCVNRGRELTQQLLGFAKDSQFDVRIIDINNVVADTAQLFRHTRKTVEVRQLFDPKLWGAEADRGQLEQVILNLLINAEQAMPEGGRIYLKTQNIKPGAPEIDRLGLKQGRHVRILIEDNGVGMSKKVLSRIFEPFFTTKEMGHGTGLGLSSVYGIIKNHGGLIDVESTPGRGSRFFVYLPASDSPVTAEKKEARGIVKGRGSILLIDDEKLILSVGKKMLESAGYQVVTAESGQQAVAIYGEKFGSIDLVILDMIMPTMSGSETYHRMKEINPDVKVLLSSGFSNKGKAREIAVRDRQAFIQKPFNLARLSQKIAGILNPDIE